MLAHERGDNLCRVGLDAIVPAIFAAVDRAVPAHHPAHVSWARRAQNVGDLRLRPEQCLDRRHGVAEFDLRRIASVRQQRGDVLVGLQLDRRKALAPARRDGEQVLAAVMGRRLAHDQAARLEAAQDAAEIAGVEPEILGDLRRGRLVAMHDLVEHARLAERELALVDALMQQPDALRVETVEAPHGGDAVGKRSIVHG